ncbi:MAG: prepilin-type N-terminal cleavage/methylation domain-containing protein [Deltaproteobacteria bacterium]|nr:prepilin-type N-terminal cleavage/methylation domain-containing protein [Deltaproteobacteria bacterium]
MSAKVLDDKALTLIELMVSMTIVGLIFAVAAVGLRSSLDVDLKKTASQLSSTLRYLSNKAVTEHLYLRMAYDFEGQSYHVEESSDPFVISTESSDTEDKKKSEEKGEAKEEGKSNFSPAESRLLQAVKFPSGVLYKDIQVSYFNAKIEKGMAYSYFFPDGFSTPTLINLKDESDESHYSLELFPLSGKVAIESNYRETFSDQVLKEMKK